MPPLPKLGPQPKSPIPSLIKFALFVGLIAGGVYWVWKNRTPAFLAQYLPPPPGAPVAAASDSLPAQVPAQVGGPVVPAPAPAQVPGQPPAQGQAQVQAGAAPPANANAPSLVAGEPKTQAAKAAAGLQHVQIEVTGPLEAAFVSALGKEVGPALTQVVTRTLVWWIAMPGDLKRGDKINVVYQEQPGQEPLVHAVVFASGKTGQTHRAYRYQPPGSSYSRYYDAKGEELELRLKNSPLDDYEQVTSLLRDGRKHKGVDFRTPVGTPVKAPFAGTITRKNWNFRGNGNCLELSAADGSKKALFLHLDVLPKTMGVGSRVELGQVIARSGNSGHSFAPHLHYQMMRGEDRVLDPFAVHETTRRALEGPQLAGLEAQVKRLDALMVNGATAATAAQ